MTDLTQLSATAIAQGVARRELSPVAVLEAHLAAIAANGFALSAAIATAMIWQSRLILLEH